MNPLTLCAFALAAAGTAFGLRPWAARRRTLRQLHQLLDRPIAGGLVQATVTTAAMSAPGSRRTPPRSSLSMPCLVGR